MQRNLYKSFRRTDNIDALVNNSKRWDEPTYMTFSVFFKSGPSESWRNKTRITNFDRFPHPLLSTNIQDDYNAREEYSTVQYLRDINETVREELLKRFISDINDVQEFYPWYFQSISGVNQLLQVVPDRGRRVPIDAKLTVKMLEGIDQKVTNMLNTYRHIAWDTEYQRWMLPDMMRYFVMEIYVTEFRTFHVPSNRNNQVTQDPAGVNRERRGVGRFLGNLFNVQRAGTPNNALNITLESLQKTLPTLKITCERCEIDINSINRLMDAYSVAEIPEQQEIEFDIKVGMVKEEYVNPILDYYYSDKVLNGFDRTRSFAPGINVEKSERARINAEKFGINIDGRDGGIATLPDPTRASTSTEGRRALSNPDFGQREMLSFEEHVSGTPFNENRNNLNSINQAFGTIGTGPPGSTFQPDFDPTEPNTWFGNAVNFGTSFLENFVVDRFIDKAKMTKIPGLGISVEEAVSAIESKNFVTVFGLVREAIDVVNASTLGPSELLDTEIVESTLRGFLQGVADSEATDEDALELKNFAILSLQDDGTFSKIMDFSRATDFVGPKEKNTPNPIENPELYSQAVEEQSRNDRSKATDLDGDTDDLDPTPIIYEGPSSGATSGGGIQGPGG